MDYNLAKFELLSKFFELVIRVRSLKMIFFSFGFFLNPLYGHLLKKSYISLVSIHQNDPFNE